MKTQKENRRNWASIISNSCQSNSEFRTQMRAGRPAIFKLERRYIFGTSAAYWKREDLVTCAQRDNYWQGWEPQWGNWCGFWWLADKGVWDVRRGANCSRQDSRNETGRGAKYWVDASNQCSIDSNWMELRLSSKQHVPGICWSNRAHCQLKFELREPIWLLWFFELYTRFNSYAWCECVSNPSICHLSLNSTNCTLLYSFTILWLHSVIVKLFGWQTFWSDNFMKRFDLIACTAVKTDVPHTGFSVSFTIFSKVSIQISAMLTIVFSHCWHNASPVLLTLFEAVNDFFFSSNRL